MVYLKINEKSENLKKWFIFDFISLIPFDAIFRKQNYNRLIRYTRIYMIFRVLRFAGLLKLFRLFRINEKVSWVIDVFNL